MFGPQQKNLGKTLNSRTETGTRVAYIFHAAADVIGAGQEVCALEHKSRESKGSDRWQTLTCRWLSKAVEKPCWETCQHRDCALDLFRVWARAVSTIGIFGPTLAPYAYGSWPNLGKKKQKKRRQVIRDALSVLWELPIIPTILVVLRSWLQPDTRVFETGSVHQLGEVCIGGV